MNELKFELGKCYKHSNGKRVRICGAVATYFHGVSLVGEYSSGEIYLVSSLPDATTGFSVITEKEWVESYEEANM